MKARRNPTVWLVISVFLLLMVSTVGGKIIFVDADATSANNGSSWADAYNYLQDALTVSSSGDEMWVAQGIYKPDQGAGVTAGDRTATFQLVNGVAIRGGYAGFGQPDPNARDIELYETILSGDLSLGTNNDDQLIDHWYTGNFGSDQSGVGYADGTVHLAIVTYEEATNTYTFYHLDGGAAVAHGSGGDFDWSEQWDETLDYGLRLGSHRNATIRADEGPDFFPDLDGQIDMFAIWNRALATSEMPEIAEYSPGPAGKARSPSPADNATDMCRSVVLSWTPGEFADTHDVYFGTDFNDVNDANTTVPLGVLKSQGQTENYYPTAGTLDLDFGQTYYWRIDEVNDACEPYLWIGDVWQFATEPFAYPITNVTATASSSYPGDDPNNTCNGSGLDGDLHSFNVLDDVWLSGEVTDPNKAWIQYEFDKVYKLHEMWVWNYNIKSGPISSKLGFKDVTIGYSTDGTSWTTLPGVPQFEQAPEEDDYAHNTTVGFSVAAKYVKITALNNWRQKVRDPDNYGLSEVRFFAIETAATEPSPESGTTGVEPDVVLSWIPGRGVEEHDVYISEYFDDVNDRSISPATIPADDLCQGSYGPLSLELGKTYYWRVDEVNNLEDPSVWESPVWSFTTLFPIDDPNLIGWWTFDEGEGTIALDRSGHENHGTLYGDPNRVPGVVEGNALDFDGSNDYVELPTGMVSSDLGTVCLWMRNSLTSNEDAAFIFYGSDETGGNGFGGENELHVGLNDDDSVGEVEMYIHSEDGTSVRFSTEERVNDDEWHHIAATWDINGDVKVYIDGGTPTTDAHTGDSFNLSAVIRLGRPGADTHYYDGLMDDVRLFDYALSQADIMRIIAPPEAWRPSPADGAFVEPEKFVQCSWEPGRYAAQHDVYFGTNFDDVNDANTTVQLGVYRGRQNLDANTYDPTIDLGGPLERETTYYWRIDEVNDPNLWTGRVWTFTTDDHLIVDDIESYGDDTTPGLPGGRIWYTWMQGVPFAEPYDYPGNGTGSAVGHWPPPVSEPDIVHGGSWSMPYYYDNDGLLLDTYPVANYSEAWASTSGPNSLEITRNWTCAKALSLWFYGFSNNDANEQMYVVLDDGTEPDGVVYYDGDMNDIKIEDWQQWNIHLSEFTNTTLSNIEEIGIGFGDRDNPQPGGSGKVYFDDIRLYPTRCALSYRSDDFARVDYVEDCVIDYKEVVVMAENWLVQAADPGTGNLVGWWKLDDGSGTTAQDSSIYGNPGTLMNMDPASDWVTGRIGGALHFDGIDDYVDCGNNASLQITGTEISLAAWVKYDTAEVFSTIAMKTSTWYWYDGYGLHANSDSVNFYVTDYSINAFKSFTADGQWHHVVGTYDGSNVRVWVDGVEGTSRSYTGTISNADHSLEIGRGADNDTTFSGALDDVRLYNVTLTDTDILGLLSSQTDLYEDMKIDFKDFAVLAAWWLDEQLYP